MRSHAEDGDAATGSASRAALGRFAVRAAVAVAIVALAYVASQLSEVVLLLFGGVLVATILNALARPLERRLGRARTLALPIVLLALVAVLGGSGWLIGDNMAQQLQELRQVLPQSLDAVRGWLQRNPVGQTLTQIWNDAKSDQTVWTRIAGMATLTLGALGSALLVVVIGAYLAADPGVYRRGLLRLLPVHLRPRVDAALLHTGDALGRWLRAQLVSMLVIGLLTAVGLMAIGVPLAGTLGLIAGVLQFVPFFGAIAAGVLAVLVAFTQGPQQALYAGLVMLAVQQAEELLVTPFLQRWAVRLPPVLGLVSVVLFSLLLGPAGSIFAMPLMVVVLVLVRELYVEGWLERDAALARDAGHADPIADLPPIALDDSPLPARTLRAPRDPTAGGDLDDGQRSVAR